MFFKKKPILQFQCHTCFLSRERRVVLLRLIPTLLIFSLVLECFGQLQTIEVIASPEYSFRLLSNADSEDNPDRTQERGKFNYRAGINYTYKKSERIWMKTGIRYVRTGYILQDEDDLMWPQEFDTLTGEYTPDPTLPHELRLSKDYLFIEIPLAARYILQRRNLTTFLEAGFSPHVYLTTRTREITDLYELTEYKREESEEFNKVQLVGTASIGFSYKIGERLQILAQPTFRYHLTKLLLTDSPIKEHLYNVGVDLGLSYSL